MQKLLKPKKVPAGRHVRTAGTPTGKFAAESVRGRKAECAVLRQILSPGANTATASCGRCSEVCLAAQPRRCLRQKQPRRSRGKHSDRVLRTKQGAVFGAVLQFLQGHSCPQEKLAKHKRTAVQIFKRTASGVENLGNGNPGQRSNFRKGAPAARRENWPSARGPRSVFCKGAATPEGKQGTAARGRGPALQGPGGENPARTAPALQPGRKKAQLDCFLARVSNNF